MRLGSLARVVTALWVALLLQGCVAIEGAEGGAATAAAGTAESGADLSGGAAARENKGVLSEIAQHVVVHALMHVGQEALQPRPGAETYTGSWTNTTDYTVHLFLQNDTLTVTPGDKVTLSGPVEVRRGLRVVAIRGDCNGLLGFGYCYFPISGQPGLTAR